MSPATPFRLTGLIAATHTPTDAGGQLKPDAIALQARHLTKNLVAGAFICGTTGESSSFTVEERMLVAERWALARKSCMSDGSKLKVIVHVGHNCLADAQRLAAHAESIGADAISALAPSYFKPPTVRLLADFLGAIASAAPKTPFYFYDIPSWTGVTFPTTQFLAEAKTRIPTCVGVKYTNIDLVELQRSLAFDNGRYDILWGCDEALLAGLSLGCRGGVGSTYNFAAPIYRRVIQAFEQGDLATARAEQLKTVRLVDTIAKHGFTAAAKSVMGMLGVECGPARLPLAPLETEKIQQLRSELEELGFFDWIAQDEGLDARRSPPAPHLSMEKAFTSQE